MLRSLRALLAAVSLLCIPGLALADSITPSQSSLTVSAGGTYAITADVSNLQDLYAFQFDVTFDPTLLQISSVTEGSFLSSAGSTFFLPGTIDNQSGDIFGIADTLFGPIPGANGSGVLVTISFDGIGTGTSAIMLPNQLLFDSNLNPIGATVSQTPEPSTLIMTATAFVALLAFLWRKRSFNDQACSGPYHVPFSRMCS